LRNEIADVLALLAGAALPLAFAPFSLSPVAVISPAVLFLLWRRGGVIRAAWRGWLFGIGMYAVGVWWVVESFQYNHIPLAIALVATGLLVVCLALFPALLGATCTLFFGHAGDAVRCLLGLPAAWALFEWLRGIFLTGFTWLQLGYSQIDTPLGGLSPITGVYGLSWCVALLAGILAWGLRRPRARWLFVLIAFATIVAGAGALKAVDWTWRDGLPMRVALIQGNVAQDLKWRPDARAPTLERYLRMTREHWDADLIVWPETALPGLYRGFSGFLDALAAEARANGTDLLIGVPSAADAPRRYYNSVVSLGSQRQFYRKRHLVPFGEYLPLKALLGPLVDALGIPVSNFSRGRPDQPPLLVAGQRVGVSICYEATFGKEVIAALPEASLLVNVSNDAWFGDTIAARQHLQIARMRALESGRYLLRATNTGVSAIVGPDGAIITVSRQFTVDAIDGVIAPMRGATPYVRWGDGPVLWVSVSVWLAAWLLSRSASRSQRS